MLAHTARLRGGLGLRRQRLANIVATVALNFPFCLILTSPLNSTPPPDLLRNYSFTLKPLAYALLGQAHSLLGRMVLLALHFPRLRMVWSRSLHATADLFRQLKSNQDEPEEAAAAAVGVPLGPDGVPLAGVAESVVCCCWKCLKEKDARHSRLVQHPIIAAVADLWHSLSQALNLSRCHTQSRKSE